MPSPALNYFLRGKRHVAYLDLIEISHSAFSQTYRKVRNHRDGVTVTLEGGGVASFDWYPLEITELSDEANLDTGIRIEFGDLGEVLPMELDRTYAADAMGEKPRITYRAYRSDDLTSPLVGPYKLEATTFSFTREGASFEASAPYMNTNKTGETYNLTRFFTQRGYVR